MPDYSGLKLEDNAFIRNLLSDCNFCLICVGGSLVMELIYFQRLCATLHERNVNFSNVETNVKVD